MMARTTALVAISALLPLLPATPRAYAQCAAWQAGPFDDGTAPNGTNGDIFASIVWDPDGAGPLASRLVVGGTFTSIEGVPAQNIAQRDPDTGQWSALGNGIPTPVYALTVFNDQLVAGSVGDTDVGTFDQTVHLWDGSSWVALSATNTGTVYAMTVYNGDLYVGGSFMTNFTTTANPAYYIARWDPNASAWAEVANGFGTQTNTAVRALAVYNGDLYAGGNIIGNPGTVIDLAHWNSSTGWTQITTGNDLGGIYAFGMWDGELIVAGGYSTINGVAYSSIAGWDGSSFHAYSTGITGSFGGSILSVTVHNGLVIGGVFTMASGQSANHVALWPPGGSAWQPLGIGLDNTVYALTSYGGELIAGGIFTTAERPANHIAHWDGFQWGPFGGGAGTDVLAMTNYHGRLVVGGDFHQSTGGLATAHEIAGWSGGSLQNFGVGMDGAVRSLKAFKYPGINGAYELVAGGTFTHAGGLAASSIARWDESLTAFPPPAWAAMGAGLNGEVFAIERFNGVTYAGGTFTSSGTTPVSGIAQWNESSGVWQPVGTGMSGGGVYALRVFGSYLYAGGEFTSAGGVSTGGLARWDGSTWSQVGGYFQGNVYALEDYNGQLVIGGEYPGINSSPNLAEYDGASYSTFSTGGTDGAVEALAVNGTRLYVGGTFGTLGGVAVERIGYWDGSWHDTQYGTSDYVYALGTYDGEVEVGGPFQQVDYGGPSPLTSPFWGRYTETGVPWLASQPLSQTITLGDDVSFTAQPATGYTGLSIQWYHDDLPLTDGPTGEGSTISGATTQTVTITNTVWTDMGSYRLEVSNGCGTVSSNSATLAYTGYTAVPPGGSTATDVFEAVGPNPSSGPTQILFSLTRDAAVQARVFDVRGRLVERLDAGRLPAGRHQMRWDARDANGRRVANGLYFVRLEIDGNPLSTKRVTVVR